MYLISIYFDEKTNCIIKQLIQKVANKSGNVFMTDGNVPPHITVSAFETKHEKETIARLETYAEKITIGTLQWVSVGTFLPHVIYLTPVLNEYLQNMSEELYELLQDMDDTIISKYYRPYQWLPHTTIGKMLSKEEMRAAFAVLQEQFVPLKGIVTKIGLAKTNPYEELAVFELKK